MRLLHGLAKIQATFDDPNLVSRAGLVPVMALAQRAGLAALAELGCRAPPLPGKDTLAFVDIDSQQKRVYGYKKQGAAFGHTKIQGKSVLVRGLNALAAMISTPLAAPVVAATRLRGGNAASARGAARFAAEAIGTARAAGCTGTLMARADSAFYSAAFASAVRRAGAFFSVTVQVNPHVQAAIAAIGEDAWIPSDIPALSGMTSCAAGSPTPKSPESPIPRLPRRKGRPSPPG